MDPTLVLEQAKRNTVYRSISPTLVEEATSSVEVIEVVLVRLAPPEVHVANFEVAPEVTRRVPIGLVPVVWSSSLVHKPIDGVVFM